MDVLVQEFHFQDQQQIVHHRHHRRILVDQHPMLILFGILFLLPRHYASHYYDDSLDR